MNKGQASIQIGKNGFRDSLMGTIKNCFNTRENVKICLLKNAGRDRKAVKEIAERIQRELGSKYTYRIVGFTIFLKKWRKARE